MLVMFLELNQEYCKTKAQIVEQPSMQVISILRLKAENRRRTGQNYSQEAKWALF